MLLLDIFFFTCVIYRLYLNYYIDTYTPNPAQPSHPWQTIPHWKISNPINYSLCLILCYGHGFCWRTWTDIIQITLINVIVTWNLYPDSKDHGANMGPTWVLPAPGGPHIGPMNLAIRVVFWIFRSSEILLKWCPMACGAYIIPNTMIYVSEFPEWNQGPVVPKSCCKNMYDLFLKNLLALNVSNIFTTYISSTKLIWLE